MKTENKLIAEFMGMEEERHSDGRYLFTTDLEEAKGIDTRFTEELYFHISWDWLMPVVEKINTIDDYKFSVNIYYHYTTITNNLTLMDIIDEGTDKDTMSRCYNAVVKFINEYNKNK